MNPNLNNEEKQYLLSLSRRTLNHYFQTHERLIIDESEVISENLKEKSGTFISLHKFGKLRGCIGHIFPIQEIYKDVIENTLAAALDDPRFDPLTEDELNEIDIEISVLTNPERLIFSSPEDLLEKLNPKIDGVILKQGICHSTFLPQVWEQIPDKETFLSHLCLKAGLIASEWQNPLTEIYTYQAQVFGEKK